MEAAQVVNAAVVGVGRMGAHHARNYAAIPGYKLVAVVDMNAENASVKDLETRHANAEKEYASIAKQAMSDPSKINDPESNKMLQEAQNRRDEYAWRLHAVGKRDLPINLLMEARRGAAEEAILAAGRQRGNQALSRDERVRVIKAFESGSMDNTRAIQSYIPPKLR